MIPIQIFLIDNASTMAPHWAHAEKVLEVLVDKLWDLDKDGIDLYFTLGQEELENGKNPKDFKDKMSRAEPQPGSAFHTDMEEGIGHVLSKHVPTMRYTKKNLTLIIFTDGIWSGTSNPDAVRDKIVHFVKEVHEIYGRHRKRSLTFQFVQFGFDNEARDRLQYLDNVLPYERDIP